MKANKDRYNKNRREKLKKDPEARAKRYGRHKKWRKERAEQARAGANRYLQRRRDNDSVFRHRCLISNLIRIYFRRGGWKKKSKTQDILGCDFNTLHTHLILSAINRYGFWTDAHDYHIDHIIPVSLATNETELIHLNHYTNLQLLTPEDNLAKSNKIAA
jgi:hypothetical protein